MLYRKEEAREREKNKKKEAREKKEREIEDAYWKETDQKTLSKKKKEQDKEKERLEKQRKKQEAKEALEQEEKDILEKGGKYKLKPPTKKDFHQSEQERINKLLKKIDEDKKEVNEIDKLDMDKEFVNENYTKFNDNVIEATGIENALDEMTIEEYDKHPEKRMKQAWNDFYERELPRFKMEYPNLKRSQYIQMIQKEFKTSPDNPVYVSNMQKAKQKEEEG
jgi:hypothetical protein